MSLGRLGLSAIIPDSGFGDPRLGLLSSEGSLSSLRWGHSWQSGPHRDPGHQASSAAPGAVARTLALLQGTLRFLLGPPHAWAPGEAWNSAPDAPVLASGPPPPLPPCTLR